MDTYNDIYLKTRRSLRAAGITAHDLEARLIVGHATGKTREELLNMSRLFVTDNKIHTAVDDMIKRRLNGEPAAYIVGEWEFYGLPMTVNENVLIPRVDTELLAGEAIRIMKQCGSGARMLDLCAGCGAVGLAVAANMPGCRIVLADNSTQALAVCRINMLRNRLSRIVTAIEADAMKPPPALLGVFDAIVCNPPYIPTADIQNLDSSVRDYEPITALDGGADGLDFFRNIAAYWPAQLKQGGCLAFECGEGQAADVRRILAGNGFHRITTHYDSLRIQRVIVGTLR